MKTQFELNFCNGSDYLLLILRVKSLPINTTVNDFEGTISNGYIFHNNNSTFISPNYTFPWRETQLFTRQIKVEIGKSTLIILSVKEKMPTLARN